MRRGSLLILVLVYAALAALALPGRGSADRPACAEAVLDDWTRGTLDSHYSPECYQAAIDALPEDLRAYTTAADDISRAAIAATRAVNASAAGAPASRQAANDATSDDALRSFPTEVAVLGVLLILLVAGGTTAALLRWRRGR